MKKIYLFFFSLVLFQVSFGQCPFTFTVSPTNEKCFGDCNGTASVIASNGSGAYTYSWNPAPGAGSSVSGLCQGTYWCVVEDLGCKDSSSFIIGGPSSALSLTVTPHNVSCQGSSNGYGNSFVSGGTPSYNYSWSTNPAETAPNVFNLPVGTVTLVVTDLYNCTDTVVASINEPPPIIITPISSSSVTCFGGTNGIASMSVTGGVPGTTGTGYTYSWSPSNETGLTATALAVGTPTLHVTDSLNCVATKTINITGPPAITVDAIQTHTTLCGGSNSGAATANVGGGTPSYRYSWSHAGETTQSISSLSTNTYTVVITDNNSCTASDTVSINVNTSITATVSAINTSCGNTTNGAASITVSGGTPSYTFSWSGSSQTNTSITGLTNGAYTVTVSDQLNCSTTKTFTIASSTSIGLNISVTHICGSGTGSSTITPLGGTPAYSYLWSNGATTSTITGLAAAVYGFTVTDNAGCTDTTEIEILISPDMSVIGTGTPVTCFGENNGAVTIATTGGLPNYTYSWTPGGATATSLTGLSPATFSITVTDSIGCTSTSIINITEPTLLTTTLTGVDATCFGCADGTASASVSGGNGGYGYSWSNGATTASLTALVAGTYTVCVSDSLGCDSCSTVTINEPPSGIKQNHVTTANLKLSPVPFDNILSVKYENTSDTDVLLSLYNVKGEVIFTEQIQKRQLYNRSIDTSSMPGGMYFISISDSKGMLLTRKISK